jgi:hypothetical protein
MKTPINKISFFSVALLFLVLCVNQAIGQSLSLFDIDASNFPTIRAKFYALDAAGKQIINLSPSDFELLENGVKRNVTLVSCPTPQPPKAISSVLTIDISGSMSLGDVPNLVLAKEAARAWIEGLPLGKSECAITAFDHLNYLIQDYTTDRSKLLEGIENLKTYGGTDYDMALINPMAGGLLITQNAKYKRVLVILSDGMPNRVPQTNQIIQEAKRQGVTIFGVTLGMPCPQSIKDMTTQTGGMWFENVTTVDEARQRYLQILQAAQGGDPCEIEWESDFPCISGGNTNVELELLQIDTKAILDYQSPNLSEGTLEFNPAFERFLNPTLGVKIDKKITVTARNASFKVINIKSSNPAFTLLPSNFELNEGESRELTISYTPMDSAYNFCKFDIESSPCTMTYYAIGGYRGKKPTVQTLKLTHPNGGETFVVGSDTVITWEGILPSDKVHLEYSTDNGQNWQTITKNASGLTYNWKNIPRPASNQCLVRVSQGGGLENLDPNNPAFQIEWQKTYGGSRTDIAYSIQETSDGGFIVAGVTNSNDGDITEKESGYYIWLLKLRFDGHIEWQKTYGMLGQVAKAVKETSDGGYIVVGNSYDLIIVMKIKRDGSIEWQKLIADKRYYMVESIQETSDGGYILVGSSSPTGNMVIWDFLIIKLGFDGSIEWQKTYGGSSQDQAYSIQETSHGGYIVAGWTYSNDGDVKNSEREFPVWIIKLDIDGNIEWQKTYGGSSFDAAYSVKETFDGGYIVAGLTHSNDVDVTENKGNSDIWVLKLSIDGSIEWQRTYGGSKDEHAQSIQVTSDGGYIIAGSTSSNDGDVTDNKGKSDAWVLKLRYDGSLEWQKTFGGSGDDGVYSVQETNDGSFILAGISHSWDGDITENKGKEDVWVVKLSEPTILQSDVSDAVFSIVEPIALSRDIDMLQVLVGTAKDSVINEFVSNTGSWKFRVDSIYIQGADASAFSLVSGFPVYTLEPNKSNFAEFSFVPNRVGIHTAEIVIITQSDTLKQSIVGEGVEPHLQIINNLIDFGIVPYQSQKDSLDAHTIKNVSNSPITITSTKHNYPNIVDFSTISGGGSFTLQPGETHLMDLRFEPSSLGRTSGTLEFHYDGVGSPAIVQLFGNGQLMPKILSFSPLCVGDLLYLFTNEVHKGQYHWSGPNGFTSTQQYIVIPNAQLHHSGRYSLYIEIEGATTDTTHFDVFVNENIVTPNDESLVFLGNTKRDDLHIELTEAIVFNSGAVWMKEKFSFKEDFVTEFKFNYTHGDNGGLEETSLPGADGLAFVILNEFNPSLGEQGGDIGYTGFRNSMAIEFDLFHNPYDPNGNHVAIQSMGPEPNTANHSIKESTLGMNKNIMLLEQDSIYFVKIMYSYVNKRLNIYLNNERTFNTPVLTLEAIDLPEFLNLEDGEFGYVGFTSATGRAFQVHNIYDWIVPCKNSPLSVYETPKSNQGIVRISPNPAENMLEVDLQLNEEGQTELLIYNMQGEKVKELFKQTTGSLGAKNLKSDISNLSSGQYYLVLITPTYITTKNLVIMR